MLRFRHTHSERSRQAAPHTTPATEPARPSGRPEAFGRGRSRIGRLRSRSSPRKGRAARGGRTAQCPSCGAPSHPTAEPANEAQEQAELAVAMVQTVKLAVVALRFGAKQRLHPLAVLIEPLLLCPVERLEVANHAPGVVNDDNRTFHWHTRMARAHMVPEVEWSLSSLARKPNEASAPRPHCLIVSSNGLLLRRRVLEGGRSLAHREPSVANTYSL